MHLKAKRSIIFGIEYQKHEHISKKRKDSIVDLCLSSVENNVFDDIYEGLIFNNEENSAFFAFLKNGVFYFKNPEEERGIGTYIVSEFQVSVQFIFFESFNILKEGDEIKIHSLNLGKMTAHLNYLTYEFKKYFNYKPLELKLNYLWSLYGVREPFEKLNQKRKNAIVNLVLSGGCEENNLFNMGAKEKFWNKESSVWFYFMSNGVFQYQNALGEKGIGNFIASTNNVIAQYILYDNFNTDNEEDEPTIHYLNFVWTSEKTNYISFENKKFYNFGGLLYGTSNPHQPNYDSEWAKGKMDIAKDAKSNNLSSLWKEYKNSKNSLTFTGFGNFFGWIFELHGENYRDIFGLYFVNGSDINLEFYKKDNLDFKKNTLTLNNQYNQGKDILSYMDGISVTSNDGELIQTSEEMFLRPWESLYLPLWCNKFNYPRFGDNDILTKLLEKAMTTNFSKVFISDEIKCNGDLFTRISHRIDFFPNGTFLRESFNSSAEENDTFFRTFGIYSIQGGQIKTGFVRMGGSNQGWVKGPSVEEQIFPILNDSEIKLDQKNLNATDGKVHPSEKILLLMESAKELSSDVQRKFSDLTEEQYAVLECIVEQAEQTEYEAKFRYSGVSEYDSWDVFARNVRFFPNGTCHLNIYSAGHDYLNESFLLGNYLKDGNQLTIKGCYLGAMMPCITKLTLDSITLKKITD